MTDNEIINRALIALVRELERELDAARQGLDIMTESLAAEEANSDRLMKALQDADQ